MLVTVIRLIADDKSSRFSAVNLSNYELAKNTGPQRLRPAMRWNVDSCVPPPKGEPLTVLCVGQSRVVAFVDRFEASPFADKHGADAHV
jgi:hypothetical protein